MNRWCLSHPPPSILIRLWMVGITRTLARTHTLSITLTRTHTHTVFILTRTHTRTHSRPVHFKSWHTITSWAEELNRNLTGQPEWTQPPSSASLCPSPSLFFFTSLTLLLFLALQSAQAATLRYDSVSVIEAQQERFLYQNFCIVFMWKQNITHPASFLVFSCNFLTSNEKVLVIFWLVEVTSRN